MLTSYLRTAFESIMTREEHLKIVREDAEGIYSRLNWNVGHMVGMFFILRYPSAVDRSVVPDRIAHHGYDVNGPQALGLTLNEEQRPNHVHELAVMAKRVLVADATELAAETLFRAIQIVHQGRDPYTHASGVSVKFHHLHLPGDSKAGSLLTEEDREFFEECAVPIRDRLRHNNSRTTPKGDEISYEGEPRDHRISVHATWTEGKESAINLHLGLAQNIFETIRSAVYDGLDRAEERI